MNEEQIKRLEELLGKSDLAEAELIELAELKALEADTKGSEEEPEEETPATEEEAEALTEDEAKALVTDSVKEANEEIKEAISEVAEKAVSVEDIAAEVSKKVSEENAKSLTAEKVKDIVAEQINEKSKGLDEESVKNLITTTIQNIQGETKMKHDASDAAKVSIPLGDRKGNLPVNQKQLFNIMSGKAQDEDIPESLLHDAKMAGDRRIAAIREGRKDLTSVASGAGAELVPTDLSSVLQERLYLESAVAAAFASQEVTMPSDPFKLPVATARPKFTRVTSENATATADTQQATASVTLDAEKLLSYVQYSYELDEDSILAVLPMVTSQLGAAAAESFEDAIINGATSGSGWDNDWNTANAVAICNGLRKLANVTALKASIGSALGIADIISLRKKMGIYGMRPSETIVIAGPEAYNDIVSFDQLETLDKQGPNASIFTGFAPKLFGMDVIPSSQLKDAHTDGLNNSTASNNSKGQVVIVHKPSFVVGVRRDFTVETDRDITTQSNKVVASFRRDFQPLETPSADISSVVWGYNIG
jgi:HK97 family phage major capsid protein|tara:strand:+ start:3506 stop:5116 length:1611 start_codon:yes stop_codon:yes gene_type:complete